MKIILPKSKKKSRFSRCYMLFAMIASKKFNLNFSKGNLVQWPSDVLRLAVLIEKERAKKDFGIKSMIELNKKKLKKFEEFLETKL